MELIVIVHDDGVIMHGIISTLAGDYGDRYLLAPYTNPYEFLSELGLGLQFGVAFVDLELHSKKRISGYDIIHRIVEERPNADIFCISSYIKDPVRFENLPDKVKYVPSDSQFYRAISEIARKYCD